MLANDTIKEDLTLTRHASVRASQRGFRKADIAMLLEVSTPIGSDASLLMDADVAREVRRRRIDIKRLRRSPSISAGAEQIAELKREISQLERLRGVKLIFGGESLVSIYRVTARRQKRVLKRARAIGGIC